MGAKNAKGATARKIPRQKTAHGRKKTQKTHTGTKNANGANGAKGVNGASK